MLRNQAALEIVVVVIAAVAGLGASSCTLGTPITATKAALAPEKSAGAGQGEGAPSEGEGAVSAGEGEGASSAGDGEGEGASSAGEGEGEGEGTSTTSNIPPPSTTRTALLANNTAAADNFVDAYQPASRFNGGGVVSNGDAPIASATSADINVGLVSKLNIADVVGAPVFVETQTWFCTNENGVDAIPSSAPADQCKATSMSATTRTFAIM